MDRLSPAGVHFLAGEPHFVDHLAPVWRALTCERGAFWVPSELLAHARQRGIAGARAFEPARSHAAPTRVPSVRRRLARVRGGGVVLLERPVVAPAMLHWATPAWLPLPAPAPVVVASFGDLKTVANGARPLALCEHGIGQSYGNQHPSYCGGTSPERAQVSLFVVPNESAARANRRVYPQARIAVVGVPRLDDWNLVPPMVNAQPPVVALSFHWNCRVAPEAQGSFAHFRSALPELARHYRVLGHGHPRILGNLVRPYERHGIEVVADFEHVLARANVYVTDNSSTLYEFAATDRPVVVLNAPWYRRNVEHGLRFWRYADVGFQCDRPEDLPACVARALADPPEQRRRRQAAVDAVIPQRDGRAAARAAAAIGDWARTRR